MNTKLHIPIDYELSDKIVKQSLTELLRDLKEGRCDTNNELALATYIVLGHFSDPVEKDMLYREFGDYVLEEVDSEQKSYQIST